MNQSQLKYLRERAAKIKQDRLIALNNDPRYKGTQLSAKARMEALKNGEYILRKKVEGGDYYLGSYMTFPAEAPADPPGLQKAQKALEKEHQQLLDRLYLGDSEEALKLLEAFAGVS